MSEKSCDGVFPGEGVPGAEGSSKTDRAVYSPARSHSASELGRFEDVYQVSFTSQQSPDGSIVMKQT